MIQIDLDLKPINREQMIGEFIEEFFSQVVGTNILNYNIIEKGLIQNRYISAFILEFQRKMQVMARLTVEVDYDRMALNISTNGRQVMADYNRSITSQVSDNLSDLINFFQEYRRKTFTVPKIYYRLQNGFDKKGICEEMDVHLVDERQWHKGEMKKITSSELTAKGVTEYELNVRPDRFDELSVNGVFIDPDTIYLRRGNHE